MFLLMITCFLVCWTPYAVVSMMEAFGRKSMVSPTLAIIPSFFAKSSTAYNPLIYVFMSRKVCNQIIFLFFFLMFGVRLPLQHQSLCVAARKSAQVRLLSRIHDIFHLRVLNSRLLCSLSSLPRSNHSWPIIKYGQTQQINSISMWGDGFVSSCVTAALSSKLQEYLPTKCHYFKNIFPFLNMVSIKIYFILYVRVKWSGPLVLVCWLEADLLCVWHTNEWRKEAVVKYQPLLLFLFHSSAAVCCSCSALGSLGCSATSKSAPWRRPSVPSDRSLCPVCAAAPRRDPRRGWPSIPPQSSSSSPAMTSSTWVWPPRLETPRSLMLSKWGHCEPKTPDFSPHHSVCLRT